MRRLRLRLLAVALALIGLVILASLEQQSLRREADRRIAEGVVGYLALAVPAGPYGDYAADRLISTVSRLERSAFWHAGLQVTVAGTPILDEVVVPAAAAAVSLTGPGGAGSVGTVAVWDATLRGGLPGASWIFAAAAFLVAGLATSRRAGWLWPLLGLGLLVLAMQSLIAETHRAARRAAETALEHIGPMAGLLVLDRRLETAALEALGRTVTVTEVSESAVGRSPEWRSDPDGGRATVQVTRGDGRVVELSAPAPAIDTKRLTLGLLGGGLVLLVAMLPPITPWRRPRPPRRVDAANIPE